MNIKDILSKTVAAVTTAAVFAMPLIACGGSGSGDGDGNDDIELRGERVTEQEWKDGIDALRVCQNYTETVKYVKSSGYMRDVNMTSDDIKYFAIMKGFGSETYKFDVQNGLAHILIESYGIVEAPYFEIYIIYDRGMRYELCNYNEERVEYYGENGSYGYKPLYNDKWRVFNIPHNSEMPDNVARMLGSGFLNLECLYDCREEYSIYHKYADFKFNENDNSYSYDDNIPYYYPYNSEWNLFFSDGLLYGANGRIHPKWKDSHSDWDFQVWKTMVCSDFGTTVIDVPSEVTAAIEEYKVTHEPNDR